MEQGSHFQEFEFRPRPLPSGDMPLGLRAAGHFCLPQGDVAIPESSTSIFIGWCNLGLARASITDRDLFAKPKQAMVVMPDKTPRIKAMRNPTEFYWCCIDGVESVEIATKLGLETGLFTFSACPDEVINDWIQKLPSQSERVERELSAAAYEILYSVAKDIKTGSVDPVFVDISSYISRNVQNYSLTIDSIAEHFNIHRSTLSNLFKKNTGASAKDFITKKRLKKAELLLTSTDDKIADIAAMCGFNDPNYFSRMFRKERSMTPREYRDALSVK
jgi:AraC-like DNA-binding protein